MTTMTAPTRRSFLLLVVAVISTLTLDLTSAFTASPTRAHPTRSATRVIRYNPSSALFAADSDDAIPKALIAASSDKDEATGATPEENTSPSPSSAPVTFMITQEMKRVLVEELGYSRKDVDAMRVELAGPIIEKRMKCPEQGMPDDWIDQSRALVARLENESKYPLKVPLLLVSAVLFGKGLSDAIVTLIKVNMDFKGASLMEEFMGVNVLGIDAVCVVVGVALGVWTWKTMRDGE